MQPFSGRNRPCRGLPFLSETSADIRCVPPTVIGFSDFLASDFCHFDSNVPPGGHYPCKSQTPGRVLRTCVFWHALRGCLRAPVDSNESEVLYLNYVTVSSKCHLKRLRQLLNPLECQALFLRKAGHCQVCSINMVFLVPEFQGQAEARCSRTLPGFLEERCGVAQRLPGRQWNLTHAFIFVSFFFAVEK